MKSVELECNIQPGEAIRVETTDGEVHWIRYSGQTPNNLCGTGSGCCSKCIDKDRISNISSASLGELWSKET